jgi:hypothetical protein
MKYALLAGALLAGCATTGPTPEQPSGERVATAGRCPLAPQLAGWIAGRNEVWNFDKTFADKDGKPAIEGAVIGFFSPQSPSAGGLLRALERAGTALSASNVGVYAVAVPPIEGDVEEYVRVRGIAIDVVQDRFGKAWEKWRQVPMLAAGEPPVVVVTVTDVYQLAEIVPEQLRWDEAIISAGKRVKTFCTFRPGAR